MKTFGIQLQEGSNISNLTVASGTAFPSLPSEGELFYRTDGANEALYVYNGESWVSVSGSTGGTSSYTITGDVSGTIDGGTDALTLATVNSNVGQFGTALDIPIVTVNAKGLVTAAHTTPITFTITGDVSGTIDGGTDALTLASVGTAGTYTSVTTDSKGRVTAGSNPGFLTANQTITLSGDVSGSGTTAITATLPTINTNVGTFGTATKVAQVTVDGKGRVTAASEVSISFPASVITNFDEATQDVVGALLSGANGVTTTYTDAANTLVIGLSAVPNASLANSAVTIGSTSISLGATSTTLAGLTSVTSTTFVGNLTGHLTTARDFSASGDATASAVAFDGAANVNLALTLASVGTAGTYGSASSVPVITTDTKGRVTGVTTTTISIAETQILDGSIYARLGANETITGSWAFNNPVVSAAPTSASHLTTKAYVDNALAGLTWKHPVKVATTANISLTGTQTIDGAAVVDGDRVLVKNQTTGSQNGVYVVNGTGVWARATDFDDTAPIDEVNSAAVFVSQGTTLADTGWTQINAITTVGTDAMAFVQFSGAGSYTAGLGLTLVGNDFRVGTASTARIVVNVDDIDLATVGSPVSNSLVKITTDNWGRVSATTAVSSSDLVTAIGSGLDSTYVNVTGDTMSGDLTLNNATYLRTKIAAGTSTRVLGVNTSDVMYLGGVDAAIAGLVFSNNGSSMAELTNTGLGIGMVPANVLDITKTQNASSIVSLLNANASSGANARYVLNNGTDTAGLILFGTGHASVNNTTLFTTGSGNLLFQTGATEKMRITNAGQVLIGTTTARSVQGTVRPFQIEAASASPSPLITRNSNDTVGGGIVLAKSRGTALGSNTAVQVGDSLGSIQFVGADGTSMADGATGNAFVGAVVDDTVALNSIPSRIVFNTTPLGGTTSIERFRIGSSGAITMGSWTTQSFVSALLDNTAAVAGKRLLLTFPTAQFNSTITIQMGRGINDATGSSHGTVEFVVTRSGGATGSFAFFSVDRIIDTTDGSGIGGLTYTWYFDSTTGTPYLRFGHATNSVTYFVETKTTIATAITLTLDAGTPPSGSVVAPTFGISNAATANTLALSTGGTERARIDASGNLQIGTTAFVARLAVNGAAHSAQGVAYVRDSTAASTTVIPGLVLNRDGASAGQVSPSVYFDIGGGGGNAQIYSIREAGPGGNLAIATETTGGVMTERMRVDSAGNLGVGGTATANVRIQAITAGTASNSTIRVNNDTDTSYGQIQYIGSTFATGPTSRQNSLEILTGAATTPISLQINGSEKLRVEATQTILRQPVNSVTEFVLQADNSSANTKIGAITVNRYNYDPTGTSSEIAFYRGNNTSDGFITFATNTSVSLGTNAVENMRLTAAGSLLINATTLFGAEKLRVAGNVALTNTNPVIIDMARDLLPANGNTLGSLRWQARGDATTYFAGAELDALGGGTWTLTSTPAYFSFKTVSTGTTTLTEKMVLGSSGFLGIGATGSAPLTQLDVYGPNQVNTLTQGTSNVLIRTSDALGADLGGSLAFGGFTTSTIQRNFGTVAGRKENATDGDSSGYLAFSTNLSAVGLAERMRITSAGNVAIGASSTFTPSGLVEARLDQNASTDVFITNTNAGTLARATLQVGSGVGSTIALLAPSTAYAAITSWQDAGVISTGSGLSGGLILSDGASAGIKFQIAAAEKMRISAAGLVGIGMTPAQILDITKNGNASSAIQLLNNDVGASADARLTLNNGTGTGGIIIRGSGYSDPGATVLHSSNSTASVLEFFTNGSEKMRIDNLGLVGIGGIATSRKLEVFDATRAVIRTSATATTGTDAVAGVEMFAYDGAANTVGASIVLNYSLQAIDPNALIFTTSRAGSAMVFKTAGTERLRIDGSGVHTFSGSTSTTGTSSVTGDATFGGNITLTRNSSTTIARNTTAGYLAISGGNGINDGPNILMGGSTSASFANLLIFRNNTNNLGVFDSSGRLLLGGTTTAVPTQLLGSATTIMNQSNGAAAVASGFNAIRWGGTTGNAAGAFVTSRSRGVADGSHVAVVSGDALGYLMFTGSDGTLFQEAARITPRVDGTVSSTAMPGRLEFLTTPSGSLTPAIGMVLNAAGSLIVGGPVAATGSEKLLLSTTNAGGSTTMAVLQNLGTTVGTGASLNFATATNGGSGVTLGGINVVSVGAVTTGNAAGDMTFLTTSAAAASEKMRIGSTGITVIGSASATTPRAIEVAGGNTAGSVNVLNLETISANQYSGLTVVRNDNTTAQLGATINLARTRGAVNGAVTVVTTGDTLGGIAFSGADGTDIRTNAAEILAMAEGTIGANTMPGRLVFSTTPAGGNTPTERMRIDSAGSIIVGNGDAIAAPAAALVRGSNAFGTDIAASNFTIAGGRSTGTGTGGGIIFQTAMAGTTSATLNTLATRLSINQAGNVVIATPFSGTALVVNGFNGSSPALSITGNSTTSVNADLTINRAGTENTSVGRGSSIQLGNTTSTTAVLLQQNAGGLQFFTTPDTSAWTERMRLDVSGNLGVGVTSMIDKFTVNGIARTVGDNNGWRVRNTADTGGGMMSANTGSAGGITITGDAGPIIFTTAASTRLTLDSTGLATFTGNVIAATPTLSTHLTTKAYVDNAILGLSWKAPVRVATTANITLTAPQTIDGVAVIAGDRVLVKNQTTTSQNGIYVVAAGAWTRATDFDSVSPLDEVNSAALLVREGTVNADTAWTQTATVATIGTDAMAFVQFMTVVSLQAGAGLVVSGNGIAVGGTAGNIVVNADSIDLATVSQAASGSFVKVTLDGFGRVTGNTAVIASDITTVLGATYSPLAGSTSLVTTGTVTTGTWSGSFGAVSGANLTSLTAGNLSGTIPTGVLGNSSLFVGTTSVALNRASANLALTGISSIALPGATSGTITLTPAAIAGATAITIPATAGTLITTGDAGTVTNTMLAGSIVLTKLSTQAANTFVANATAGVAAPTAITGTAATALLDTFNTVKGLVPGTASSTTNFLRADGTWAVPTGATSGTVTTVSVASANGFAGTVATATSTPAITLSTTITGLLKGNATAISAATAGTDYSLGTSALATGILKSTTTTGALTIAVAADFPTLNQNTTGTASFADDLTGGNATTLLGSIPYQSNTNVTTLLSPNVTTTKMFLSQTGTSVNGAAPAWSAVSKTDVGLSAVENTALSTWAGTANITTLGTIATGTWNATVIADGKIATALSGKTITTSTYNGLTLTANATGFSVAGGTTSKTLTVSNSITLAGTDATTITLPSTTGTVALNNQTVNIGTTAIAINRASANLALTGISSVAFPGATSGTATLQATAVAGTPTVSLPITTGTLALDNQAFFLGTTSVAINRASATLNVAGIGSLGASGAITFTAGTASTTTGTGTLVVTGGVGVSGQVTANNAAITASTATSSATTGALVVTGGIGCAALFASGDVTAFSDERIKTNIEVIPNALEKVCGIRGVTYTRTDNGDLEAGKRSTGVIAQDVQAVLPEAVVRDAESDLLGVNYGNLAGLLIEAIKDLRQENLELKARLAVLEAKEI